MILFLSSLPEAVLSVLWIVFAGELLRTTGWCGATVFFALGAPRFG